MRSFLFLLSIILITGSSGYGQVDTLRLVEVNNIDIPEDITEIYAEDLDNDNINELIICTHDYIYIYDSQTNELLWASPELFNPQDLIFTDINGDETVDIAVHDSLNIFIFDITNSFILWSSPYLDATYKCYTIGDRNNDELLDVAIVRQVPTNSDYDYDTVYVDYYDGPAFQLESNFSMLVPRYHHHDYNYSYRNEESPTKVILSQLSGNYDLEPVTILFTYRYSWHEQNDPEWIVADCFYGAAYVIDGINLILQYGYSTGLLKHESINTISGQNILFTINYYYSQEGEPMPPFDWECTLRYRFVASNADSVLEIRTLYHNVYQSDLSSLWYGFKVADLNQNNVGDELFMAYRDSLFLYAYPEMIPIWWQDDVTNFNRVLDYLNYSSIFSSPQVICRFDEPGIGYIRKFISGEDGSLTAVLYLPEGFDYHKIVDLNNDNDDEFLSIQGNEVRIYHLDDYVDIDNQSFLPYSTFIKSNYPNPFNTSTTIEYGLKQDEHVTIDIYDILGRKVETLIDTKQQAGSHKITWNADYFSSGVYFYKLQAGDYIETKKMILLK